MILTMRDVQINQISLKIIAHLNHEFIEKEIGVFNQIAILAEQIKETIYLPIDNST